MREIIFLSGPYSAETPGGIARNIEIARQYSARLWDLGYTVLCPHLNTAHFELICKSSYEDYVDGYLELLRRCDAVVMIPGWRQSPGAVQEHMEALVACMPIYCPASVDDLEKILPRAAES